MPRIDPQQLLKCLSVLLTPKGGVKSKDEVQRLASLMTKFSKKLVSKCIYVSILKATETDLLIMFMSAGGWDLTFSWLSDGVAAKNWPLVIELVDLLLICPVDIDRLKTNACPKLIKTLSKDPAADERVRQLACKLVEQWLKVVRGDTDVSFVTKVAQSTSAVQPEQATAMSDSIAKLEHNNSTQPIDRSTETQENNINNRRDSIDESSDTHFPVRNITIRNGEKVLVKISGGERRSSIDPIEEECSTPTSSDEINQEDEEPVEDDIDDDEIRPVKLKKKRVLSSKANKLPIKKPAKVTSGGKKDRDSTDSASSATGKPISKQKDNAKPSLKKTKIDSSKEKSNIKNKNNILSPKSKDVAGIDSDTAPTKKAEDSNNTSPKQKEKLSLNLKNKKSVALVKDVKDKKDKNEKVDLKEKNKIDEVDTLTEKEKESLNKFITPPISKVGKIPKKTAFNKEEKQSEEKNRALKDEISDNKIENKKHFEVKKPEIKRPEKNFSISVEPKRSVQGESRPKTVKTYNSKFRSTGLEEEIKPPPPRVAPKKPPPPLFSPVLGLSDKKLGKRSSPPPEPHLPEKKSKPESPPEEKKTSDKSGGIKLIPPKPKPMFLQESDVFMDAMLATMKEPRKRKRKPSLTKESGPSDPKKDALPDPKSNSPANSPKADDASPSSLKPTFKFYQDTLDTSTEEEKSDKMDDENLEFAEPDQNSDDQKSGSEEDKPVKVVGVNGPLKGVLVHLKSKRQKKSVSWKEDGLECIKYFELDETERVNVTKNFSDMKLMEREHERENFQLVRKLAVDDIMEERTRWKALIPIDIAAPVVAPGKNSQEKEIQYAREKTVPAAIYFNKRMIPDSPAEPDLEIHAVTDPAIIPLDDITGSTDSINDFTNTPWPEPRGVAPAPAPIPIPVPPQQPAFAQQVTPAPAPTFQGPFPPMPPGAPFMPPGPPMPAAGDCWRTGDGKVVGMGGEMFPPQGMMGPPAMGPMGPPGPMMMPPGVSPEIPFAPMMGPNPSPEELAHFGGGFPQMGPSPPHQMGPTGPFPPPVPPQGPQGNWQGGGGNWFSEGDQNPHHNQGGSGPGPGAGRYQGNNWRGRGGGRNPEGNWGGGGNSRMPLCNNIIKKGFCRNNNCRFRHPR